MGNNALTRVFERGRAREDGQHQVGPEKHSHGDLAWRLEGAGSPGVPEGGWGSPQRSHCVKGTNNGPTAFLRPPSQSSIDWGLLNTALGAGPRSRCRQTRCLRATLPGSEMASPLCVLAGGRGEGLPGVSLARTLIPPWRLDLHHLVTSQSPPSSPRPRGVGFQHTPFGET